ncbi:MAG: zinc ribbon domain-containing protein [Clostridia bacterium]|nr:zinc ribbon domain-containing protein [Clostridia bacterium]
MFCPKCGEKVRDNAAVCSSCGCAMRQKNDAPPTYDTSRASGGKIFLSLMIPIVGIAFWFSSREKEPNAAKTYLMCGLISWGLAAMESFLLLGILLNP